MKQKFKHRKLSKLTGESRPSHLLFFDTETKQKSAKMSGVGDVILSAWDEIVSKGALEIIERHRLKLGWTCFCRYVKDKGFTKEVWRLWDDTKQLCKYIDNLTKQGVTLFLFGHNIFFDLQVSDFFYYFTKWGWTLDFWYDKGVTYILIIRKDNACIKCVSTTNYFPVSLEKLGEFLGLPKLKIDFERASRKKLISYCKRDVEIIKRTIEYWLFFIDKHKLGRFSLAKAGQAMSAYRFRFMNKPIYLHKDTIVQELERSAYFGGRVECYRLGKVKGKSFVDVDINSMYPFVMKKYAVPTKLLTYEEHVSIDRLSDVLNNFAVVAEVVIDTDEPAYAVRHKGKVVFPVGSFVTFLCTPGLKYALAKSHILAVKQLAVYRKDCIFKEYVNYLTKLKKRYSEQQQKIMRTMAKDLQNSLYGKFAQRKPLIQELKHITYDGYCREETLDIRTHKTEIITKMFNTLTRIYGDEPSGLYFAAISAHITEYARFYLYELIKRIGKDNILYCDTDSLKFEKKYLYKLKDLLHSYQLGKLKIEDEFKQFEIYGAKYYKTENVFRMKGVPANAKKVGKYTYRYTAFLKQPSHLRAGVTRYFITKEVTKVVKPSYDKGKVLKDGRVVPLKLTWDG